jgi:hypothetical protein
MGQPNHTARMGIYAIYGQAAFDRQLKVRIELCLCKNSSKKESS